MGGIIDAVTSPVKSIIGGGSEPAQTQNTTVNTSSSQNFEPINNIDTKVEVNIDVDKLANVLETSSNNEISTNKAIADNHYNLTKEIATKNYQLNYAVANENIKNDLTNDELDNIIKKDSLKINALTLDEQKQQNKRMTMIALGGLAVTLGGVVWSNSKGGKK